ncbi:uncharacterized protein LOC111685596 isoform X1 [Lucilia cuprina]|uniref:uncharacterized protein LOC111685596 isoform X1 n=2 Tax=Lucilia cuprina TaxID=7375 RepID=UPI001F061436|nr:uncharacterized protein LOC111685596 isoform X1 [Lucilia cuprina]
MHSKHFLPSEMNLNFDTFIKQEVFNTDEELLHSSLNPNLNIPVKNEPITDEPLLPLTAIKNEPLTQETLIEEEAITIKTENPIQNHTTIPGDSFIIYELETPAANTTLPLLPTHSLQNEQQLYQSIPVQINPQISALTLTQTKQQVAVNTTTINPILTLNSCTSFQKPETNKTTPAKASAVTASTSAPPVLLNAQLRKRHKVVLPVNPIDKRTRYNIEGSKTKQLNKTPTSDATKSTKILNNCRSLNAGNKKIINHLIKHKQLNQNKEKETSSTIPVNISKQQETIPIIQQISSTPTPLPPLEQITKTANIQTEIKQEVLTSSPPHLINPAKVENSLTLRKETKDAPLLPELRVKCLCSLTAASRDNSNNNLELKDFFQKMFEETRKLNKTQQRKVKMLLLQAISESEELMEQGKCCGF